MKFRTISTCKMDNDVDIFKCLRGVRRAGTTFHALFGCVGGAPNIVMLGSFSKGRVPSTDLRGGGRKIQIYLIHKVKFSKIGPIENKIIPRILSPPGKNSESAYGACMTTIIFPGI